ncbi:hypothetical protein CKJ84_10045 [Corynebacterium sp. NML 120412]|nr:hypothetical protein CKJ84_10045 [Corynebacterium sp. NML 120412]
MNTTQKIKNGALAVLSVFAVALIVLWATQSIGLGLLAVSLVLLVFLSVGIRIWAENSRLSEAPDSKSSPEHL